MEPHNIDPDELGQHVDESSMADHDSLYSNPQQAAKHLLAKFGREEAMEHFTSKGWDEDEAEALVRSAQTDLSKSDDSEYETIDRHLFEAIEKSSWWIATEFAEGSDISKAPRIWRESDDVPEAVRETIAEVIDTTAWDWMNFDSLTTAEANKLEEIVKKHLSQPSGWNIKSLANEIAGRFFESQETGIGIAADATHNVLNVAREEAYEDLSGSEKFVYSWIGPSDHRTTPVCREAKEEIADRGGAVTMPTMKQILREKAIKYKRTSEGGGTPQRVNMWEPHYQCRHTFVREI